MREPTAQMSFVSFALKNVFEIMSALFIQEVQGPYLILHTTPPDPPESSVTKFRIKSPVFTSHNFTVPSSELVMTNFVLNWRQVTAD